MQPHPHTLPVVPSPPPIHHPQTFSATDEFLHHIALARGKLRRGGTPDAAAAARIVLQDWNDGRIPYYTTPPERPKTGLEDAQVGRDTWHVVLDT